MKLSKETLTILQNFCNINPSIMFIPGNVIKTVTEGDNLFASATVTEEFPVEAPIYDLGRLLGLISLNKENTELHFGKNNLEIVQGRSKISYAYAQPQFVKAPPKGIPKVKNLLVDFELKNEEFTTLIKAMNILGFNEIAVIGEDGELSIQTLSSEVRNDSSDNYKTVLGECEKDFEIVFNAELFRFLPKDYYVQIDEKFAHFKSDNVEYWVVPKIA